MLTCTLCGGPEQNCSCAVSQEEYSAGRGDDYTFWRIGFIFFGVLAILAILMVLLAAVIGKILT